MLSRISYQLQECCVLRTKIKLFATSLNQFQDSIHLYHESRQQRNCLLRNYENNLLKQRHVSHQKHLSNSIVHKPSTRIETRVRSRELSTLTAKSLVENSPKEYQPYMRLMRLDRPIGKRHNREYNA